MKRQLGYIRAGASLKPEQIPNGAVVVHNNVYPDGKNAFGGGFQGSRAWIEMKATGQGSPGWWLMREIPKRLRSQLRREPATNKQRLVVCRCAFAPGLTHYRYKLRQRKARSKPKRG